MITAGPRRRPGRPAGGTVAEGERRAAILMAARRLFQQHGYAAVSMQDVATAVGLTKAAVHYHFLTKAELYAAVMRSILEQIQGAIRRHEAAPGPAIPKLIAMTEFVVLRLRPVGDLDAMMRDATFHLTAEQRSEIAVAHRGVHDAVAAIMRQGIAHGELKPAAPDVLAHAFLQLNAAFGGPGGTSFGFPGRPEVAAAVIDLFLHGAAQRSAAGGTREKA